MTPSCRAKFCRRSRRGFTLVELLVAITISVIIVLALAAVTSGALKSSTTTTNSLLALSAANAALDLVVNDLASVASTGRPAVTAIPTAGQPLPSAPYEFLQARVDPNTAHLHGTTPALLMLNTTSAVDSISTSNDLGMQPRAVCYQIAYQDPINPSNANVAAKVYGLYRTMRASADTFANFLGTSDLFTAQWQSLSAALPSKNSFIVGNVVDLQFVFYACPISAGQLLNNPIAVYSTANAGGKPLHLTSMGYVIDTTSPSSSSAFNPSGLDTTNTLHGPIVCADVIIVVLDSNGALQLEANAITLAKAKALYGHTLTRRVFLRQPF